VIDMIQAYYTV